MKKKTYRRLDIIWRIIGGIILLLFIYDLYIVFKDGIVNTILNLITFGSMILYAIISTIIFLPAILIKLFKKLKKILKK